MLFPLQFSAAKRFNYNATAAFSFTRSLMISVNDLFEKRALFEDKFFFHNYHYKIIILLITTGLTKHRNISYNV